MRRARTNRPLLMEQSGAHPLADALATRLVAEGGAPRVLLIGAGDGRNIPPLIAANLQVDVADTNAERLAAAGGRFAPSGVRARAIRAYGELASLPDTYEAVLSTHALLHGDQREVAVTVASLAALLVPSGLLYATFGSRSDARCTASMRVRDGGWAEPDGAEAGVVHAYFDDAELRRALAAFTLESLTEIDTAALIGGWAHAGAGREPRMHWFVVARRRPKAQ